jgi:ESCRT-II complex subunit VPS36
MALRRYTRSVDGTIPVHALLYNDEQLLASQENVGIYDGYVRPTHPRIPSPTVSYQRSQLSLQKAPNNQNGTVHVSTHRLFYIDSRREFSCSFALDLSYVTQTDYYAGLFKSSPKVTLHLLAESSPSSAPADDPFESWECEVCSYRNPPGLSPSAAKICALCGVPRNAVANTVEANVNPPFRHHSTSLPSTSHPSAFSSSTNLSRSVPSQTPPPPASPRPDDALSCPACTFLNHPSLLACEMCGTQLSRPRARPGMKSAPTSRPASPDVSDDDGESRAMFIKLSFRKGGDKPFYGVLKRSLKTKAWKVLLCFSSPPV